MRRPSSSRHLAILVRVPPLHDEMKMSQVPYQRERNYRWWTKCQTQTDYYVHWGKNMTDFLAAPSASEQLSGLRGTRAAVHRTSAQHLE
jgi:hypothetical protein